jgi:hypothetical protein
VTSSATSAQAMSASAPRTAGKNRLVKPSASTSADTAPTASTARTERPNRWSARRPSSGSVMASNSRAASSTAPSVASGMPNSRA